MPLLAKMLVAYEALRAAKFDDEHRMELKIRLFRKLLERGYDRGRIVRLTSFLQHYIHFAKPEMYVKFEQQLDQITHNTNPMGIIETIVYETEKKMLKKARAEAKAEGKAEGKVEGLELGLELGLEQGLEKGKTETKEEMVKRLLASEFFFNGMMTYQHIADLTQVPMEQVQEIHKQMTENSD